MTPFHRFKIIDRHRRQKAAGIFELDTVIKDIKLYTAPLL